MRLLLVPMIALIASAASAATMEQVAVASGQIEAGYNRAKFLCLATGIPMPTLEKVYPSVARDAAQLKAEYPDFYALGAAKGLKQANNILSDPRDMETGCAMFKKGIGK